jgi:glycosyltransferase involved in cell wall biosynthesis
MSKKIIKLLVLSQNYDAYSDQMLSLLVEQGVRVFCVLDPQNREKFPKWKSSLPIHAEVELKGRFDASAANRYATLMTEIKPDVCLCYTSRALSIALRARKQLDFQVPIVGTRGAVGGLSAWYVQDWFSYLNPSLEVVVCLSNAIASRLKREAQRFWSKHPGRFVTIYPGYSHLLPSATLRNHTLRDALPLKTIISLSNERPIKGMHILLDALEHHVTSTHWKFVWIGEVSDATLKRIKQSPVLAQSVQCLGYRSDAKQLLAHADIYVQPTLAPGEGIGNAIAEAMASELPVITSNIGGAPELLDPDTKDIQTFIPGDALSLGIVIDQFLSSTTLCNQIGTAGRRRISNAFAANTEANEYLALFNSILAAPP